MFHQFGNWPHGRDPAAEAANRAIFGLMDPRASAWSTAYCLDVPQFSSHIFRFEHSANFSVCVPASRQSVTPAFAAARRFTCCVHAMLLIFTNRLLFYQPWSSKHRHAASRHVGGAKRGSLSWGFHPSAPCFRQNHFAISGSIPFASSCCFIRHTIAVILRCLRAHG